MPILLLAVALVAGSASGGLPYFDIPNLHIYGSLDLQPFGMLVATGVLVGAELCRRYALRFGVDDDDLRKLTGWVVVSGFIGAHLFDVLAYQRAEVSDNPLLIVELWKGISSYGGFIGGAIGLSSFIWIKRMRWGLTYDIIGVGLLPGFAIGRIGCSIVHDHIGRATDFFLGFDYPKAALQARFCPRDDAGHVISCDMPEFPGAGAITRAHNLGFYELLYLTPVCALVLMLAFSKRRLPGGFLSVMIVLFYAPVRFFFEFLRLNSSDPRYLGLTFAQWMSFVAFGAAIYGMQALIRHGKKPPLAAELDGIVGGYQDGVAAPKRATVADAAGSADEDAAAKKPAAKKPVAKKSSARKKR